MREREGGGQFDGGYAGGGLLPGDKAIGPLNYIQHD